MSRKQRRTPHRPPAPKQPETPRWRQVLLLASVVPMLAGVVLFAASWFGHVWIGTGLTQTVTGALLACFGFAFSNAVQAKWTLAGGWALLGVAVWLLVAPPVLALRWVGGAAGLGGMVLVLLAFLTRFRQVRTAS